MEVGFIGGWLRWRSVRIEKGQDVVKLKNKDGEHGELKGEKLEQ